MLPMYRLLVGMASHPALPRAGGGSVCIALDLQALHLQVCLRSGHLLLLRPSVGDAAFMPLSAMQPSSLFRRCSLHPSVGDAAFIPLSAMQPSSLCRRSHVLAASFLHPCPRCLVLASMSSLPRSCSHVLAASFLQPCPRCLVLAAMSSLPCSCSHVQIRYHLRLPRLCLLGLLQTHLCRSEILGLLSISRLQVAHRSAQLLQLLLQTIAPVLCTLATLHALVAMFSRLVDIPGCLRDHGCGGSVLLHVVPALVPAPVPGLVVLCCGVVCCVVVLCCVVVEFAGELFV